MHALRERIGGIAAALAAVLLAAHAAIHPGLEVHRHAGGDHTHIHVSVLEPVHEDGEPDEHAPARHAANTSPVAWHGAPLAGASAHWHARTPLHPAVVAAAGPLRGVLLGVPVTDTTYRGAVPPAQLPVRARGPPGPHQFA